MFQFRLSTLMIAITGLAVFFAIPGMLGIPVTSWILCVIFLVPALLFWLFIISSKFVLSGNTETEATLRLMIGVVAAGSMFGNAVLGYQITCAQPSSDDFGFSPVLILVAYLGTSIIGAFLAGVGIFFLGLLMSLLYVRLEDAKTRAICSALAGAVVGAGWILFVQDDFGIRQAPLLTTLVAAGFGAIGGGLPELLQIRSDKRAALAKANVPRETIDEAD